MVFGYCMRVVVFMALGLGYYLGAMAAEPSTFDTLSSDLYKKLGSSPKDADSVLEKLRALQSTFTPEQNEKYQLAYAHSLGDRGKHAERVALVESFIGQVKTPARRASFLYELIDGYTALGRYESALRAMNESILLLPAIEKISQKIVVLQGALNLLRSLHAYDEALDFAERIYALRGDTVGSYAACVGLANKVETNYARGDNVLARSLVPDAILACDVNKNQFMTLIVKALAAIDLIDSGNYVEGIATSLPLLQEFSVLSPDSDYAVQLQEALARAYLKTANLERAEHLGRQAYQRAQSGNALELQEKTSETMAAIRRAQGQLAIAIGYYDKNLALKRKVLDDQVQRNLAYQRVKFDAQDKANQLALLEQKNKSLGMEKVLQERRYQNLTLLMVLGLMVLGILGAWFIRALKQRNLFRQSAQVDGLTLVSSRAHFTTCAQRVFKDTRVSLSLVLFDMDFFKKVNDTYGHATGDWVLKAVCDTAKLQLQKVDLLGRLGGEEFAMLLPMCTDAQARALAERCREAIAAIDTLPSGFDFPISASFGIATRAMDKPGSFEEALVAADKALYLSKNEGRNRVTVYQHSTA